jgi:hypothetical protein
MSLLLLVSPGSYVIYNVFLQQEDHRQPPPNGLLDNVNKNPDVIPVANCTVKGEKALPLGLRSGNPPVCIQVNLRIFPGPDSETHPLFLFAAQILLIMTSCFQT